MTPELVEQWKKMYEIAIETGNEQAIKDAEQQRAEMIMDCQQKTATRVKELIARQNEITSEFKEIKGQLDVQRQQIENNSTKMTKLEMTVIDNFKQLKDVIEKNEMKQALKEAEIKGGKRTFNIIMYIIAALCSCGGGAIVLKLIGWFASHPVS